MALQVESFIVRNSIQALLVGQIAAHFGEVVTNQMGGAIAIIGKLSELCIEMLFKSVPDGPCKDQRKLLLFRNESKYRN